MGNLTLIALIFSTLSCQAMHLNMDISEYRQDSSDSEANSDLSTNASVSDQPGVCGGWEDKIGNVFVGYYLLNCSYCRPNVHTDDQTPCHIDEALIARSNGFSQRSCFDSANKQCRAPQKIQEFVDNNEAQVIEPREF
jgi:hypothetical protein